MTVNRGGQQKDITATPASFRTGESDWAFAPTRKFHCNALVRCGRRLYAVNSNLEILRLTGKALGQVFTGQRSARNTLSGPIGIYNAAAASVERLGWAGVFGMLGFLSLNLGIFNLLPIPVLDGGAIFLLLIEGLLATVGLTIINDSTRAHSAGWFCDGHCC